MDRGGYKKGKELKQIDLPSHWGTTKDSAASPSGALASPCSAPPPAFSHHCLLLAVSTEEKESYHRSAIQNLNSFDPFVDASKGDDLHPVGTEDYIHIRIQQRNGRKTLATIQGITDDYD